MKKVLSGTLIIFFTLISFSAIPADTKAAKQVFCGPSFSLEAYTSLRRIILQGPNGQEVVDYPGSNYVFPGTYSSGAYKVTVIPNLPTYNAHLIVVNVSTGTIVGTTAFQGVGAINFPTDCSIYKFIVN